VPLDGFCPVCRNVNDGGILINAHSRRNAEVLVIRRTLTCDFCNAEVMAKLAVVKVWFDTSSLSLADTQGTLAIVWDVRRHPSAQCRHISCHRLEIFSDPTPLATLPLLSLPYSLEHCGLFLKWE
jgi:hypothetical protein